jgi:hypothetical protein
VAVVAATLTQQGVVSVKSKQLKQPSGRKEEIQAEALIVSCWETREIDDPPPEFDITVQPRAAVMWQIFADKGSGQPTRKLCACSDNAA